MDNLVTPAMYQDIGMSSIMSPMMGMYGMPGMMYPSFGIKGLNPALSEDKFQKIKDKEEEDKQVLKKTGIAAGIITAVGLATAALFKIKTPKPSGTIFKGLGTKIKNSFKTCWQSIKTFFNKINVFKRNRTTP